MRRFEKKKNIQKLNERLNKQKNSLSEYFNSGEGSEKLYFDHILQGEEATEENAYDHARGVDWMDVGTTPQRLPNGTYIDTVNGVEIYYDRAADYYYFAPAENDMEEARMSYEPHGSVPREREGDRPQKPNSPVTIGEDDNSIQLSPECLNRLYAAIKSFTHNNPNAIPGQDYQIYGSEGERNVSSAVGKFQIMFDKIDYFACDDIPLHVMITIDREVYDANDSALTVTSLEVHTDKLEKPLYVEYNERILNDLFPMEFMRTYERVYRQMNSNNQFDESEKPKFNLLNESTVETFKKLCGVNVIKEDIRDDYDSLFDNPYNDDQIVPDDEMKEMNNLAGCGFRFKRPTEKAFKVYVYINGKRMGHVNSRLDSEIEWYIINYDWEYGLNIAHESHPNEPLTNLERQIAQKFEIPEESIKTMTLNPIIPDYDFKKMVDAGIITLDCL